MQVIADTHGNTLWLGERDCSAQRRHQKLVEESPAPDFPDDVRQAMGEAAVKVVAGLRLRQRRHRRVPLPGRRVLLPGDEHPAAGGAPGHRAGDRPRPRRVAAPGRRRASRSTSPRTTSQRNGHAIEVRINAEDPSRRALLALAGHHHAASTPPAGPGVRLDAGYESGDTVSQFYDNLVAKLIVWAPDREAARRRMLRAIDETPIEGVATTCPADVAILTHPDFVAGRALDQVGRGDPRPERPGRRSPPAPRRRRRPRTRCRPGCSATSPPRSTAGATRCKLWVPDLGDGGGAAGRVAGTARSGPPRRRRPAAGSGTVTVPMQGTIVKVLVAVGDAVEVGQTVCVLEAMKMENNVNAEKAGDGQGGPGRRRATRSAPATSSPSSSRWTGDDRRRRPPRRPRTRRGRGRSTERLDRPGRAQPRHPRAPRDCASRRTASAACGRPSALAERRLHGHRRASTTCPPRSVAEAGDGPAGRRRLRRVRRPARRRPRLRPQHHRRHRRRGRARRSAAVADELGLHRPRARHAGRGGRRRQGRSCSNAAPSTTSTPP